MLIVLGHASTHLNITTPYMVQFVYALWRGLPCLFVISGFLVSASFDRSKSNVDYLVKRGARLYPGLWVAFIISFLCVLFIGGKFANLNYDIKSILTWTFSQLTVFQFYTPEALAVYGVGNPNGALWTISLEIQMYILIMLFLPKLKLKKMSYKKLILLVLLALIANIFFPYTQRVLPVLIYKLLNVSFIPYAYYFLIGVIVYIKKDAILTRLSNMFWILFVVYLGWRIINVFYPFRIGHYTDFISGILLCLCTLSGAYHFGQHRLKHDFSFSVYLYHMIVINAVIVLGITSKMYSFIFTLVFTFLLAFLSCIVVEEPIMHRIKNITREGRRK